MPHFRKKNEISTGATQFSYFAYFAYFARLKLLNNSFLEAKNSEISKNVLL